MKPLSLISFELLVVSCILLGISIIMKHVNSMHTLHTIMTNLATFRVHIAPLGFEIDRIIPVSYTHLTLPTILRV